MGLSKMGFNVLHHEINSYTAYPDTEEEFMNFPVSLNGSKK